MITQTQIVSTAREWLGTPYFHQSDVKGIGCDCLGLILGVYKELGGSAKVSVPPYSASWKDQTHASTLLAIANATLLQDKQTQLQPGRILLFQMARDYPLKHCAIMSSDDHFIHAQERVGVAEVPLSRWWKSRVRRTYRFKEEIK